MRHSTKHSAKRQGQLNLVLLGSAAALAACQPANPYSTQVEPLKRSGYASKTDCVLDWGSEDRCEEDRTGGSGSGGGARYWGPYYSSSGRVYGYDGVTGSLRQVPIRATEVQRVNSSESQVYQSGKGKYAAAAAKVSRGGFGGGGRGFFSSGGG
jgi:hypothetical protein